MQKQRILLQLAEQVPYFAENYSMEEIQNMRMESLDKADSPKAKEFITGFWQEVVKLKEGMVMKNIQINNQAVQVKEYKGQRVVTFKDIDRVHGRPEGTAKRAFSKNRGHFTEGVDYFLATVENTEKYEKRTFIIPTRGVTLLTESGYLMLVKSFTDKLAWQVQRKLVDTYFRAQSKVKFPTELAKPVTPMVRTYKGIPVVTIRDIERVTGVTKNTLRWYIRGKDSIFVEGEDYFFVEKEELRRFKEENPSMDSRNLVSSLILITRSGCEKFAKQIRYPNAMTLFEGTVPTVPMLRPERKEKSRPQHSDIPDNKEAQQLIEKIRRYNGALNVMLELYARYNEVDKQKSYQDTLADLGTMIFLSVEDLKRMEVQITDKKL